MEKIRVVFAQEIGDEYAPFAIGAIAESSSEHVPLDEWERIRNDMAEMWLGPDWDLNYDIKEILISVPEDSLWEAFKTPEINLGSDAVDVLAGT